jgi:hypothetical protein
MKPAIRRAALAVFLLTAGQMLAQEPAASPSSSSQALNKTPWEISLTVDGYLLPDEGDYASPVISAHRKWLHLEARYNYEDLRTGSLWAGYNFSAGEKLVLSVTPMIGGVFGRITGIAPGCEASLSYKKVELSISNEYVFDTTDKSKNFYYSWPQLTYSANDWLRVGLAAQRTKAFQTTLDVQRGFLVGLSHKQAEFTAYVFNVGWTDPSVVLEFGWSF